MLIATKEFMEPYYTFTHPFNYGFATSINPFELNLACKNIRFSLLFVAGDVLWGETSATQRQKFHTDDIKSVRNLVRSADW